MTLLAHLRHNNRLFSVALIIWRVLPIIRNILVSVLPVGIGFGLMVYTLWADELPRFATPALTFNTMFAFLNGDVILETLQAVGSTDLGVWAYVPMVLFFCLFTYVVLNICLVCIEFTLEQVGAWLAALAIEKELAFHAKQKEERKKTRRLPSQRARTGRKKKRKNKNKTAEGAASGGAEGAGGGDGESCTAKGHL